MSPEKKTKKQGEQQQGVIIKHNSEYLVLVWIFYNSVTFFRLIISFLLHCTRLAEPDRRLCARFHRLTAALLSVTFPLTPRGFRPHTSLCRSQAFVQKHGRVRPCEHLQVVFVPFFTPSGPIRQTTRPQFDLVLLLSGVKHIYVTSAQAESVRNCNKWTLSWYSASLINTADELWWWFRKDGRCLHPTMWDLVPSSGHWQSVVAGIIN